MLPLLSPRPAPPDQDPALLTPKKDLIVRTLMMTLMGEMRPLRSFPTCQLPPRHQNKRRTPVKRRTTSRLQIRPCLPSLTKLGLMETF